MIPFLVLVWDFLRGTLAADPILDMTHRTGKTALILLMLSLAVSPLQSLLNWPQLGKLRRPLGLYSFAYAAVHFAIFIGLDYGFQFSLLPGAFLEKRFAIIGFLAGLILLILAVTSLNTLVKKLGKNWKVLHRFVYAAGVLAAIHFIMAVKPGVLRPWFYAGGMLILLVYRIPFVRSRI
jgi:sulfoxide reductase heme-binding subunit YedZ